MCGMGTLPVVLTASAAGAADVTDAVYGLIDVVNEMYGALLTDEEIGEDALVHYYLDYYLAQVSNGGHSQFLYNSARGDAATVMELVGRGLRAVGVEASVQVFEEFVSRVEAMPEEQLTAFLTDGYVDAEGFHPLSDLEELDERLYEVSDEVAQGNGRWLLGRDDLLVIPDDQLAGYLESRQAELPDLDERRAAALAAEPSYLQAARAYCAEHGLTFDRVTAGEPVPQGDAVLVRWHFVTDVDHYSLLELPDGEVEVRREGRRSS